MATTWDPDALLNIRGHPRAVGGIQCRGRNGGNGRRCGWTKHLRDDEKPEVDEVERLLRTMASRSPAFVTQDTLERLARYSLCKDHHQTQEQVNRLVREWSPVVRQAAPRQATPATPPSSPPGPLRYPWTPAASQEAETLSAMLQQHPNKGVQAGIDEEAATRQLLAAWNPAQPSFGASLPPQPSTLDRAIAERKRAEAEKDEQLVARQARIAALEAENAALRATEQRLAGEVERLALTEEELATTRKQLTTTRKQAIDLTLVNEDLSGKVAQAIAEQNSTKKQMEGELAAAHQVREDLEAEIRELRGNEQRLHDEHAAASKAMSDELAASQQEVLGLESDIKNLRDQEQQLQEEHAAASKAMSDELAAAHQLRADLEAENKKLRENEQRLRDDHAAASKAISDELAASKREVLDLESDNKSLRDQEQQLRENQTASTKHVAKELADAYRRVADLQAKNDELREREEALRDEFSARGEIMTRQLDYTQGEVSKLEAVKTALQEDVFRLREEHAAVIQRLQDEHSAVIQRLEDEHAAATKNLQDGHAVATKQLQDEHAAATTKLQDEHASAASQRQTELASSTAHLQGELTSLRAELATLSSKNITLSVTSNLHTTALAHALTALEQTQHRLSRTLAELAHLRSTAAPPSQTNTAQDHKSLPAIPETDPSLPPYTINQPPSSSHTADSMEPSSSQKAELAWLHAEASHLHSHIHLREAELARVRTSLAQLHRKTLSAAANTVRQHQQHGSAHDDESHAGEEVEALARVATVARAVAVTVASPIGSPVQSRVTSHRQSRTVNSQRQIRGSGGSGGSVQGRKLQKRPSQVMQKGKGVEGPVAGRGRGRSVEGRSGKRMGWVRRLRERVGVLLVRVRV